MADENGDFQLYKYTPNRAAGIAFAVLFALATVVLIYLVSAAAFKSKKVAGTWMHFNSDNEKQSIRFYMIGKLYGAYIPLIVGCVIEIIGYIGRSISSKHQQELGPYVLQSVLLLIAPTLYAASIYMLFGRLAHLLFAESLMIMPARFETLIFVLGDVASLLMQAAGGGLMASADSATSGSNLVTAGLFVQIAFFGLFIINEFLFLLRIQKANSSIPPRCPRWKNLNLTLLITSFLILIRSIVRAVEFIEGYDGHIASHEYFLYIFDTTPMFILPLMFIATDRKSVV